MMPASLICNTSTATVGGWDVISLIIDAILVGVASVAISISYVWRTR